MKLNLLTLNKSVPALQALTALKLPLKISYDIKKRIKVIDAELEIMTVLIKEKFKEMRAKIQEDFVEAKTDEEKAKIEKKFNLDFEKEITEFLESQEIELDILPLELDSKLDIKIKPAYLSQLDFLIQVTESK
jgi:hypothetical protein